MRRRMITAGVAAILVFGPGAASHATVLCKTKKGGLVVREACKKKEAVIDEASVSALGLKGEPGPAGPPGPPGPPGPNGGGLRVVDANGAEVGLVTAITSGYYGGTSTNVVRQVGQDWLIFSLSGTQFAAAYEDDYYGSVEYYTAPDCTGPRQAYGSSGLVSLASVQADGKTAQYARGSEVQAVNGYTLSTTFGASPGDATARCVANEGKRGPGNPGVPIGQPSACADPGGGSVFCQQCCAPIGEVSLAPIREVDVSSLVPPFRLSR